MAGCWKRRLVSGAWVGMMALGVCVFLFLVAGMSRAQGMNQIIVVYERAYGIVDVEPGNPTNGVCIINGTVRVKNQTDPEIVVNLYASAGSWNCTIEPNTFVFRATERENRVKRFTIVIRAPMEASHRVTQVVKICGSWRSSTGTVGDIDPMSLILFVKQYFDAEVEVREQSSVGAGRRISIPVTIWNTGNDEDDFSISIENQVSLESEGWSFESIPNITIDEKLNGTVQIDAIAPDSSGRFELILNVTSVKSTISNPDDLRYVSTTIQMIVEEEEEEKDPDRGPVTELVVTAALSLAVVYAVLRWRWLNG